VRYAKAGKVCPAKVYLKPTPMRRRPGARPLGDGVPLPCPQGADGGLRPYCPRAGRPAGYTAMTPNQLRTTLARIGLSQRGAARLLDIDERTMRKYVAGDLVIPEMLVWALRGLSQREQDQDANSAA
jgi:hypothetical protein